MLENITKLILFNIFLIFFLKKISFKFKLLDIPDNRKKHLNPTPYTGGLLISLSYFFLLVFYDLNNNYLEDIIICCIIISFLGFLDDKVKLTPGLKILFQLVPVVLIVMNGLILNTIGEYKYLKINFGSYSLIFTILCYLLIINAKNYIDGLDGLATSLFLNSLIILSIYSNINNIFSLNYFLLLLTIPVVIFLFLNLQNNSFKFFLGDGGSNLLGLLLGSICIYLFKFENLHPALIVWSLTVVIYDFLSTCIFRIFKNKKNLFKAGTDHIHYELGKLKNIKHNFIKIILILNILNFTLGLIGLLIFYKINADVSLLVYILTFPIYFYLRIILKKKIK